MNRRKFIKNIALSSGLILSNNYLHAAITDRKVSKLTILHTNDFHSHIDPFPLNDPKYPGQGGIERRAALINQIRRKEENVLLLDAGDIFQGTPYFNFYKGELEFKAMSQMGYDASTLGNHDFDNGLEGLDIMLPHANFPFINSNYAFENTPLKDKILKYKILNKNGINIGVFGLGVELEGLVLSKLYGETKYLNPVEIANKQALFLKQDQQCDLVICLSHLGYHYENNKIDDLKLAKSTKNIDIIIGGHTHTFLDEPVHVKNSENSKVVVNQVGWAGLRLGRIDVLFFNKKNNKNSQAKKIDFFHEKNLLV